MTLSPEHIMAVGGILTGLVGTIFPQFRQGKARDELRAIIREECVAANGPLEKRMDAFETRMQALESRRR